MADSILLINCYPENKEEKILPYREALRTVLQGKECEIFTCDDYSVEYFKPEFRAIIISGSSKMISQGQLEKALVRFILKNRKPLLGICYGHQMLARAFGCQVGLDHRIHQGEEEVIVRQKNSLLHSFPERFPMLQSHSETVTSDARLHEHFFFLAENTDGGVEVIRHRENLFYGVQFHPERSGPLGIRIIRTFLSQACPDFFPDP